MDLVSSVFMPLIAEIWSSTAGVKTLRSQRTLLDIYLPADIYTRNNAVDGKIAQRRRLTVADFLL
jgi:hypothetical protein